MRFFNIYSFLNILNIAIYSTNFLYGLTKCFRKSKDYELSIFKEEGEDDDGKNNKRKRIQE